MNLEVFESFNNGQLRLPGKTISFADISWSKHPVFEGVELKHIITSKDTNGEYSYHLVLQDIRHYSEFISLRIDATFTIYGNTDLSIFNITYHQMIWMRMRKI